MSLSEKFQTAQNKGSIAMFVSSILQNWEPPMHMQRKLNTLILQSTKILTIGELFKSAILVDNIDWLNNDFWYYHILGDPCTRYILTVPELRQGLESIVDPPPEPIPNPNIVVTSPSNNEIFSLGSITINFTIENFVSDINSNGNGHIHIIISNSDTPIIYDNFIQGENSYTTGVLSEGNYTITFQLVDSNHNLLNISDSVNFNITNSFICFAVNDNTILYESNVDIAAFQFDVIGSNVTSATTEVTDFILDTNGSTVIGYSLQGSVIPFTQNGCNILTELITDNLFTNIGNIIVSDVNGSPIPFNICTFTDCPNYCLEIDTEPYLNLELGWNLISCKKDNSTINLTSGNILALYTYDSTGYQQIDTGSQISLNSLKGYWIKVSEGTIIEFIENSSI
jgi:hypothetical protein